MTTEKITVRVNILSDKHKVWNYYTNPEHITKWNFADLVVIGPHLQMI